MKQFAIKHSLFTALILLLVTVWNMLMPEKFTTIYLWVLTLFFYITTIFLHWVLIKKAEGKQDVFIRAFLGTVALKLLIYLIVLVAFAISNRSQAVPFILSFLVLYLFYTVFEVIMLFRNFNRKS